MIWLFYRKINFAVGDNLVPEVVFLINFLISLYLQKELCSKIDIIIDITFKNLK